MGGGVLTLMDRMSLRQVEQDAEVSIWFLPRPETPDDRELVRAFDQRVGLKRLCTATSRLRRYVELFRRVRAAARSGSFDVIHLHSSLAGGVGRLASIAIQGRRSAVVYSPHGFAFLRQDTNVIERNIVLWAEKLLARTCDLLILSSPSELQLAETRLGSRAALLHTGAPSDLRLSPRAAQSSTERGRLRVGMVGRICYQKAPWRFAAVAAALKTQADFVWIGGGTDKDITRWIGDADVQITGWLPADQLTEEINRLDVLLFPTLWEGMAISLMQAQVQGVPAVVSNVVGNVDSVVDGKTGFVCSDDDELKEKVELLLTDHDRRRKMAAAAAAWSKEALLDTQVGVDSLAIYNSVIAKRISEVKSV